MATLQELLDSRQLGGPPKANRLGDLSDYFSTSNVQPEGNPNKTRMETLSNATRSNKEMALSTLMAQDANNYSFAAAEKRKNEKNWFLKDLASGLWSFTDTATFGIAGWAMPDDIEEEWLTPKSAFGDVWSAIGGTAGFVVGAPMKLGAKAAQVAAKPFIKQAGAQTVASVMKTSTKMVASKLKDGYSTKAAKTLVEKTLKKRINHEVMKSRWDQAGKGVAENWVKTSSNAIDELTSAAKTAGDITLKEMGLIRGVFKKNLRNRPMNDIVDVIMARHPNKFGFVTGSMIHEAAMFGMIDAAMEGVHAAREGRAYDWSAPLWGVGIGGAFGMLKLLPAAGKSSITSEDFSSGFKALFAKKTFAKAGQEDLSKYANILGRSLEANGESTIIKFGKHNIDLLHPISTIGKKEGAEEILRGALISERRKYGKMMMREAVKEDFKSTLANWPRVIGGTAIMNIRTVIDMMNGHEVPTHDLLTSIFIGAFINRKGKPLTPEMNMKKMQHIRRGLNSLGSPQYKILDMHPTLNRGTNEFINPLTDRGFNKLKEKTEKLDIVSDTTEVVETMRKDGSPSLASSQKSFPLFDEAYMWMQGTSNKKYIKSKALITEKEAAEIEATIKSLEFEGQTISSVKDFRDIMQDATDKISDTAIYEVKKVASDIINNSTSEIVKSPDRASLGTIPEFIAIDANLEARLNNNSIKTAEGETGTLTPEVVLGALGKANNILKTVDRVGLGERTQDPNKRIVEIRTEEGLRSLIEAVNRSEVTMNETFSNYNGLNFDFNSIEYLESALLYRHFNKSSDRYSEFYGEKSNPEFNELRNELLEAGLIVRDSENIGGFRLLNAHNITVEKVDGFKGSKEETLKNSIVAILAAKNNKSLPVDTTTKTTVSVEQMARFESFLQRNKVPTDEALLNMFTHQVTQRIYSKVIDGSEIQNRDIAIMNELMGMENPMASYSPLADGGTGFAIRKIKLAGHSKSPGEFVELGRYEREYNSYVDQLAGEGGRGTNKDTGQKFISIDKTLQTVDAEVLKALRSVINRKGAKEGERAAEVVKDMVNTLQPTDTLRQGIVSFVEKSPNPDQLLTFLMSKGLITTKEKQGAIDYFFKPKALESPDNRQLMQDWLKHHGVHTSDIEAMQTAASKNLDNYISQSNQGGDHKISQQSFFDKYWPHTKDGVPTSGSVKTESTGFGSTVKDVEAQNQIIKDAIFDPRVTTRTLRVNPVDNIIKTMSSIDLGGGNYITGETLLSRKFSKQYLDKYREVRDDAQSIVASRVNAVTKTVLDVQNGSVKSTEKVMQDTPFLQFLEKHEIPHVFVSGDIYVNHWADRTVKSSKMNVFDMESPHNINGFGKDADKLAHQVRTSFNKAMKRYEIEGSEGSTRGLKFIRFGNAKNVLAVPETHFSKIKDIFESEIYQKYIKKANGLAKDRLEGMMDALKDSKAWGDVHADAMRTIMVEQLVQGKNQENFLNVVVAESGRLSDIGKRFSLYHTPSFKRFNKHVLDSMSDNLSTKDNLNLLKSYKNKGYNARFVVWNDIDHAGIKSEYDLQLQAAGTSWKEATNNRKDVSGFDSIAFISKDYKGLNELYYGVSKEGSTVFKPIIGSNGPNHLLFAKTVFVYDPNIQKSIFDKTNGLDIILTASADKLKGAKSSSEAAGRDVPILIDKDMNDFKAMSGKEINSHIKTIPLENIGVSMVPESQMNARQSYSKTNFMDSRESSQYFDTFYKTKLENILGTSNVPAETEISKLMGDSMYRRLSILQLKNVDADVNLSEFANSPEGLKNMSAHLQWAALGGDPLALGESVLQNLIKKKFIDTIISPESVTKYGEQYGAKTVIKQDFTHTDMAATIVVKGKKGETKIKQHGEMYAPHHLENAPIKFTNSDIELMAVNHKGAVVPMEVKFIELVQKRKIKGNQLTKAEAQEIWDHVQSSGTLGSLHTQMKAMDPNWSIAMTTTRYPRTAPNDLAILRLKGFLSKEEGNTGVINKFDVLNIFEGDYDVDKVDFFWGLNKGTWDHIGRVKNHWVNAKNPEHYAPPTGDLQLMTKGMHEGEWNKFDANNRVFKRGIGVVQKTIRLVNHTANLGVKNSTEGDVSFGMNDLMVVKGADGKEYKLAVDYDNASWFARTALESQLIIDYWKGVHPDIVNKMVDWRYEYLFPTKANSIGQEQITSNHSHTTGHVKQGSENTRIRIFRKFEVGKGKEGEVDLTEMDKTIIKSMMSQHSKFLTLTREVYDGTGQAKPSTYSDIMSIGGNYFEGHLNDITRAAFMAARRKHGNEADFKTYFNPDKYIRKASKGKLGYYYGKKRDEFTKEVEADKLLNEGSSDHWYQWYSKSPFMAAVLENAKEISKSGGREGSVPERIFREIVKKDPLGTDGPNGRTDVIPQGDFYNEIMSATSLILSNDSTFGGNMRDGMASILPTLTKNVNTDIKYIKYLKRTAANLMKAKDIPNKTKLARLEGLNKVIREKEALLKDILTDKYKETGASKHLETIRTLDISREKDVKEGTIQWYTLHEFADRFSPAKNLGQFSLDLDFARSKTREYYNEFMEMGESAGYKNLTLLKGEGMKMRQEPFNEIKDVEAKLHEILDKGYRDHGLSFLINYALPAKKITTIGVFNGSPMPVSTAGTGRFKRIIRYLFEKKDMVTRPERQEIIEVLETLAKRYSAYRNMFDKNFDLISLKDQDVLGALNNVPGFSRKLTSTFDRYDSHQVEKSVLHKDVFGMGPEYDRNVSFYRSLIHDVGGRTANAEFKKLEGTLSYTNQLLMENNYLDPVRYFMLTEKVRTELSNLGIDKPITESIEGGQRTQVNSFESNPSANMLISNQGGVTIKPMAMLSNYRLDMLKKFIQQGRDVKINQKREAESWNEAWDITKKVGC